MFGLAMGIVLISSFLTYLLFTFCAPEYPYLAMVLYLFGGAALSGYFSGKLEKQETKDFEKWINKNMK